MIGSTVAVVELLAARCVSVSDINICYITSFLSHNTFVLDHASIAKQIMVLFSVSADVTYLQPVACRGLGIC